MIYLVTGAAGFIGSHICKKLLENPKNIVVGIDNLNHYYPREIKKRRIQELTGSSRFIFYRKSFYDPGVLIKISNLHHPESLIHTAAQVGVRNGEQNPVDYIQTNTFGTSALIETVGPTLKQMVIFSSSSVYGDAKPPFVETKTGKPMSVYGLSKSCMEEFVINYYNRNKTPTTIVRPFSVYGPDGRPDMLPMKLIMAAANNRPIIIKGEKVRRDWTYIGDLTDGIIKLTDTTRGIRIVNIARGLSITNRNAAETARNILKKFGYDLKYNFSDTTAIEMPATQASTELLKKECGYAFKTSFAEGFEKTSEFYFTHRKIYESFKQEI
jgi:UDP-glucuronate 4-epimerase